MHMYIRIESNRIVVSMNYSAVFSLSLFFFFFVFQIGLNRIHHFPRGIFHSPWTAVEARDTEHKLQFTMLFQPVSYLRSAVLASTIQIDAHEESVLQHAIAWQLALDACKINHRRGSTIFPHKKLKFRTSSKFEWKNEFKNFFLLNIALK